jgi:hypothetical protein
VLEEGLRQLIHLVVNQCEYPNEKSTTKNVVFNCCFGFTRRPLARGVEGPTIVLDDTVGFPLIERAMSAAGTCWKRFEALALGRRDVFACIGREGTQVSNPGCNVVSNDLVIDWTFSPSLIPLPEATVLHRLLLLLRRLSVDASQNLPSLPLSK